MDNTIAYACCFWILIYDGQLWRVGISILTPINIKKDNSSSYFLVFISA